MLLDLVDVFCGGPLGGNPLAVVRGGEALTTEQMLALTRWLGFSETTFLLPPTDPAADYRVRIFYPAGELPFAWHPTLGSAFAWMAAGGVSKMPGLIMQECGVGLVEVRGEGKRLAFRAPPLIRSGPLTDGERAEAAQRAGVDPEQVLDAVHAVNGPPWKLLRLGSAAEVLAARPEARAPLHTDIGLIGPHEGGEVQWPNPQWPNPQWEVRAFFTSPLGILTEDPVTGSFNAAAAQYLYGAGLASGDYVAAQGQCVGALGRVYVSRDEAGVWIGGDVRMVAAGAGMPA